MKAEIILAIKQGINVSSLEINIGLGSLSLAVRHSPKIKTLHIYTGIHYAWEQITPVPPNAGSGIQSFVGMLNFISWGMNSPIFSIGKGGN